MKMTRQGVRDLDEGRPKRKPNIVELPVVQFCKHPKVKKDGLTADTYCPDCGTRWDWNGKEY